MKLYTHIEINSEFIAKCRLRGIYDDDKVKELFVKFLKWLKMSDAIDVYIKEHTVPDED